MIKRTRKEHSGYTEWKKIHHKEISVGKWDMKLMFQRWQYFYKKGKQSMDCVQFSSWMYEGMDYEIYGVIDDVERFSTLEEAEKRIEEVMGDKIKR